MENRREKSGSSDRLSFLGLKITVDSDCSHKIKRKIVNCLCLYRDNYSHNCFLFLLIWRVPRGRVRVSLDKICSVYVLSSEFCHNSHTPLLLSPHLSVGHLYTPSSHQHLGKLPALSNYSENDLLDSNPYLISWLNFNWNLFTSKLITWPFAFL